MGEPARWWSAAGLLAVATASAVAVLLPTWRPHAVGASTAFAVLCLAWAVRSHRAAGAERVARRRQQALADARAAEVERLAKVRLPAVVARNRAGQRVGGVPGPSASAAETGEEFARSLAVVADALGSEEAVRRERALRDSVQAAFESVARTMHAMATVQQQVLDRVEQSLEDPAVMAEVMKADHAAAQMTRKAQTLLVMCGIWPARRETRPVSLYDCVRGAQSRIVEFGRVEVHGGQSLYVVPPAVEGLMHAVAELLENATVFSPSRTQVVVTVREVGAGAVVEIDDAGLGMPPDGLHQAMAQLREDLDLAMLGAVPRLGLACVGRWARELGFNVELTGASAYGGTRAVAFVPHRLLTEPLSHVTAPRFTDHRFTDHRYAREPVEPRPTGEATRGQDAWRTDGPPDGEEALPRRRNRRRGPQPQHPAPGAPDVPPADDWTPEAARASIASVLSGSRRGRAAAQNLDVPERHDGGRP